MSNSVLHWLTASEMELALKYKIVEFCLPKLCTVDIQTFGSGHWLGMFTTPHNASDQWSFALWQHLVPDDEVWVPHKQWPDQRRLDVVIYPKMSTEEAICKGHLEYLKWTKPCFAQRHMIIACRDSTIDVIFWLRDCHQLTMDPEHYCQQKSLTTLQRCISNDIGNDVWKQILNVASYHNRTNIIQWVIDKKFSNNQILFDDAVTPTWNLRTWTLMLPYLDPCQMIFIFNRSDEQLNDKSFFQKIIDTFRKIDPYSMVYFSEAYQVLSKSHKIIKALDLPPDIPQNCFDQWLKYYGKNEYQYHASGRYLLRMNLALNKRWKLLRRLDEYEAQQIRDVT